MKDVLEAYFDGELDDQQAAELRRWLAGDRANVREFLRESQLNWQLHAISAVSEEFAKSARGVAPVRRGRSVVGSLRALALGSAAALLVLGCGVLLGRFAPRAAEKSLGAVTGQALIVRGNEVVRSTPGMHLQPTGLNEIAVEKGGSAVVQMADGSTIRLPGGARVMMAREGESKRIYLLAGYFDAEFTKQTRDSEYVLMTHNARAVVLGTTLRMSVNSDGSCLSVVNGNVLLTRLDGTSAVDVTSRQEAVVDRDVKKEMKLTRLHWAERFSGGAGGGAARGLYAPASARFKGG